MHLIYDFSVMLLEKNFTIVDVETTGGSPFFNRVIEIGLLRVEKGEVVEEYRQLFNPGMALPEFISEMTGITDADLVGAPHFEDLAEEILGKFENAIFVAHNSQFDFSFLKEEFRRAGLAFNVPQLCTVRLSRVLYKQHKHHNLTAVIERFGFECENRHRAFDDAKVLWDFLRHVHGPASGLDAGAVVKAMRQVLRGPRAMKSEILKSTSKDLDKELIYEDESGEAFTIS